MKEMMEVGKEKKARTKGKLVKCKSKVRIFLKSSFSLEFQCILGI